MGTVAPHSALKVFLIAENRLLREAIAKLLGDKDDIRIVGASPFLPQVLEQVAACQTDILLLGASSVAISRLEFIQETIRTIPGVKVIMTGMEADEQTFLKSVRGGAVGYVLKDASATDMEAAVRAVARGEAVCPAQLCSFLFRYVSRQSSQLLHLPSKEGADLSRRERQLVPLIANGLTNKEIASELCISEQTVKNHIHHMLRKLGAGDRLQVVEMIV